MSKKVYVPFHVNSSGKMGPAFDDPMRANEWCDQQKPPSEWAIQTVELRDSLPPEAYAPISKEDLACSGEVASIGAPVQVVYDDPPAEALLRRVEELEERVTALERAKKFPSS